MIDLTDSFFEGVKISPKNKIGREPVPKNNCCWIKRTAGKTLCKYGSTQTREGTCDGCIAGVSQIMVVSVLLHSNI